MRDTRVRRAAQLVLIGPKEFLPESAPRIDRAELAGLATKEELVAIATPVSNGVAVGRVSREAGEAALAALELGADLATSGVVEALVTAPVCKEALHLAGERVEGQTELLARWNDVSRYEMLAIAGEMRVMLLSRHLPLARALERVTTANVLDHLRLLAEALRGLGFEQPNLALAGLNPHAGENGLIGSEELEVLMPAVLAAREEGLRVSDPQPPDTIFIRATRGEFDAVLALYHDQAFIPLKLAGSMPGIEPLTTIAGLSYLRVSPAHGTAFDIAGSGAANPDNLIAAVLQAAEWVRASLMSRA